MAALTQAEQHGPGANGDNSQPTCPGQRFMQPGQGHHRGASNAGTPCYGIDDRNVASAIGFGQGTKIAGMEHTRGEDVEAGDG